ncbi:MAG TPA: T6SS effector amidase Tae4 family protein [Thermoanaerobaculia bacterium]
MPLKFADLRNNYPTEDPPDLFRNLGGGWPALISNPSYANTCTIRLSVALNRVGYPVPADLAAIDGNHKDGAGNHIAIRVPTGEQLMIRHFGASTWGMSRTPGTPIDLSTVPAKTGVLVYLVTGATNANGHIDLWDGSTCLIDCHVSFAKESHAIQLWEFP